MKREFWYNQNINLLPLKNTVFYFRQVIALILIFSLNPDIVSVIYDTGIHLSLYVWNREMTGQ